MFLLGRNLLIILVEGLDLVGHIVDIPVSLNYWSKKTYWAELSKSRSNPLSKVMTANKVIANKDDNFGSL